MRAFLLLVILFFGVSTELNSKAQTSKHTVRKGETMYSIAKRYGITVAQLAKANSISVKTQVKIGQRLTIPGLKATKDVVKNYKPIAVPSTPDTPYREEDIRPRPVFIQHDAPKPVAEKPKEVVAAPKPAVVTTSLRTASSNPAEYQDIFTQYGAQGYKIKRSKGLANYISEATSGNQHLAFYNDAETGSVIRVINLLNHKTIYVKVIGKVPAADAASGIALKLSNQAAQDLEVKEDKFLVEVHSFTN